MSLIPIPGSDLGTGDDDQRFAVLVESTLATLRSDKSRRVYADTYRKWRDWCASEDVSLLSHTAGHVRDFLSDQAVTLGTRKAMLSHMRKLAQVHAVDYTRPHLQAIYQSLTLLAAPDAGATENSRQPQRQLTPDEVRAILDVWWEDGADHVRNYALLCLLFATGVRRAEAVALRWEDIDLDAGIMHVRRGKGGKSRYVAVYGDEPVRALQHWREVQGFGREWVFCPLDAHRQPHRDEPISTDALYDIVQRTIAACGVHFTPHTCRHTLITQLHDRGVAIANVQAQAGHALLSTTGRYLHAKDAAARRKMIEGELY